MKWDIKFFESISSTNEAVKQAIREGSAEGTVVVAREQSGGYGRQGRTWASPRGGLYMSVLLRPVDHGISPDHQSTLSLVASLAVRETLAASLAQNADRLTVKWPNDVLYEDKKLVGISLEALNGTLCIGIGINVFAPEHQIAVGGKNEPSYYANLLEEETQKTNTYLDKLAQEVLHSLAIYYKKWLTEGFEAFIEDYNAHAYLTGKTVTITDRAGNQTQKGQVAGTDEQGRLLLKTPQGAECITAGEAHLQ